MTAPARQARRVIRVSYIKREYYSRCPFDGDCPLSPGRGLPWVAMKPQREASIEALYVHLHRVHDMLVPEIEALPIEDA